MDRETLIRWKPQKMGAWHAIDQMSPALHKLLLAAPTSELRCLLKVSQLFLPRANSINKPPATWIYDSFQYFVLQMQHWPFSTIETLKLTSALREKRLSNPGTVLPEGTSGVQSHLSYFLVLWKHLPRGERSSCRGHIPRSRVSSLFSQLVRP